MNTADLGTPLGRYEKAVGDAIGARWYLLVQENMSTLIRTEKAQIHFVITRTGKPIQIRAKKNSALASISIQAVTDAELPPIPAEVAATLPGGQLEVDYTFEMFE